MSLNEVSMRFDLGSCCCPWLTRSRRRRGGLGGLQGRLEGLRHHPVGVGEGGHGLTDHVNQLGLLRRGWLSRSRGFVKVRLGGLTFGRLGFTTHFDEDEEDDAVGENEVERL